MITLCMIVKDEERFLDRCLSSVKGVVDEIVVVDTGSTDSTSEIAKSYGASVYSFAWTGSFSDARNAALARATGDWVLVLDADEELDAASRAAILYTTAHPKADAYELVFRNYITDGDNPDVFTHRTCRLFKNDSRYRYRGRIHEMVTPSIEDAGGKVAPLDAVVHHRGYLPSLMKERDKHQRYIDLLLDELKTNPKDVHALYNLGAAYWSQRDYQNALAYFEQASQLVRPEHGVYAAAIFFSLVNALNTLAMPDRALAAAEKAEQIGICHPQLYFCKGNALILVKRFEDAIPEFKQAIELGRDEEWTGDSGAFGYKACFGIASACRSLGRYDEAIEYAQKVLSEKPGDSDIHELLGDIFLHLAKLDVAEQHYRQAGGTPKSHVGLGQVLKAQGKTAEALASFVRALETDPHFAECYFQAGDLLLSIGQPQDAVGIYQNGLSLQPDNIKGFIGLGDCYRATGAFEAAAFAYRHVLQICPGHAEAAAGLAEIEIPSRAA